MRLVSEISEMAPVHSGSGVAVRTPRVRRWLVAAFLLTCCLIAPYLGLGSRVVDPRIAEIWPVGGVGFVVLTTIWDRGPRVVCAAMAGMLAVFVATALAMGFAPVNSVWMGLMGLAQPLAMIFLYRRHLRGRGWIPETPVDVAAMLFAAASSSLVVALLGGFPLLPPFDLSPPLLWWVLRNTVYCYGSAVTVMLLLFATPSSVLSPSPLYNRLGLLGTALLCVFGTYQDPSLPLSWLLIVPCVWGGLTLTLRGTGWLLLVISLIAAGLTYLPQNQFGYSGTLPAASIVDLLVIASSTFALLLTLMREQRGQLIARLDLEVEESEEQRALLTTIFDSMNDGVMIMGRNGVTMYNAAARQLLGRPIPVGEPRSWVQTLGLRGGDGRELDDGLLLQHLFSVESAHAPPVDVRVGDGSSARILDVRAQSLGTDQERSAMILLHDVTAQRARMRELGNFAGMVAHDLRGPLTVLDGWLEVVQDERAHLAEDGDLATESVEDDEGGLTEEALAKARDASKRMRRVIEDWLSYTVVQNGQLRPDATKLSEVATEIVEGRLAHNSDGEAPQFHLDLTHSVQADPGLLRQLLDNLVGNAIKYTPAGQAPWVLVSSAADSEPGWVRVEVVDHGVGIPPGQEELIFEEFHRGPEEGRSAGTGLGLALARRIVALHGGRLTARRNADVGSTFSLTLPEA